MAREEVFPAPRHVASGRQAVALAASGGRGLALTPTREGAIRRDFRVGLGQPLQELFEQVLTMLTMKGLLTLERVAEDGTKIPKRSARSLQ